MIALGVREAEQPFLQNRVPPVPKRDRQTQRLTFIGKSAESVFAPPVGTTSGMIVGDEVPGVSVGAVVLADGSPLPLTEVGTPAPPLLLTEAVLLQPLSFFAGHEFSKTPNEAEHEFYAHTDSPTASGVIGASDCLNHATDSASTFGIDTLAAHPTACAASRRPGIPGAAAKNSSCR
jgi:hypothetical protein